MEFNEESKQFEIDEADRLALHLSPPAEGEILRVDEIHASDYLDLAEQRRADSISVDVTIAQAGAQRQQFQRERDDRVKRLDKIINMLSEHLPSVADGVDDYLRGLEAGPEG